MRHTRHPIEKIKDRPRLVQMSFLCGSFTALGDLPEVYPITAFDEKGETPVILIEVASNTNDGSRRLEVTEDLIETYIGTDYGVS